MSDQSTENAETPQKQKESCVEKAILLIVMFIIAFPLVSLVYRFIPEIRFPIFGGIRIDYFLTILVVFGVLSTILNWMKNLIYMVFFLGLILLTINEFRDGYGFKNVFYDYSSFVLAIKNSSDKPIVKPTGEIIYANASKKIVSSVDYTNPEVRNFAVKASTTYFSADEYYNVDGDIIRYFSVFKYIKERWKYVSDPKDKEPEEYFAKASESIQHFGGDCDDYTILMAACIKAIGGEVKMIIVPGHIFPVVKVGRAKDWDRINYLVSKRLFADSYDGANLNAFTFDGFIWMNFDYTASYPGGDFMSEDVEKVIDL
jgi:hypothetical protein